MVAFCPFIKRELFSVLEDVEAKNLKQNGEEAWGGLPGKVGVGFDDGFPLGILQCFGLKPGLDSSQVGCPTMRGGMGIL